MWEWAIEFKALFLFVGSHVGMGRRVQGSARVCRAQILRRLLALWRRVLQGWSLGRISDGQGNKL